MGRVIAIVNQKGGVGKTTTAVNLAAALAMQGRPCLLIDVDPQCSATSGVGVRLGPGEPSTYDVLLGESSAEKAIRKTLIPKLQVLGASQDLVGAEIELVNVEQREQRLKDALSSLRWRYDFVIIDCPPSLNILTLNALIAADGVLIPMQCEYYALEGLTALLETVEGVRQQANPSLSIEGLLRTMYDPRNGLTRDVSRQLIQYFGDRVFRTVIPRNVRLAEAPSHGLPAILYDRQSRGAVAYMALAGEIKRKHEEDDDA